MRRGYHLRWATTPDDTPYSWPVYESLHQAQTVARSVAQCWRELGKTGAIRCYYGTPDDWSPCTVAYDSNGHALDALEVTAVYS